MPKGRLEHKEREALCYMYWVKDEVAEEMCWIRLEAGQPVNMKTGVKGGRRF
jgi:hypothetical protein